MQGGFAIPLYFTISLLAWVLSGAALGARRGYGIIGVISF